MRSCKSVIDEVVLRSKNRSDYILVEDRKQSKAERSYDSVTARFAITTLGTPFPRGVLSEHSRSHPWRRGRSGE